MQIQQEQQPTEDTTEPEPVTADENEPVTTDDNEPVATDETDNTTEGDIIEKSEQDSPPRLPVDFYYEPEKVQSKPLTTDEKTFPQNTLSM